VAIRERVIARSAGSYSALFRRHGTRKPGSFGVAVQEPDRRGCRFQFAIGMVEQQLG
jgi:hypothetical protein